jgi:hypothetical protein
MAEFNTFDLGRVFQTAEAIKSMRRQGTIDRLQEQYLGQRIEAGKQEMDIQKRTQDTVLGKEKAQEVATKTAQILQAPNTKNYVEQFEPDLVKALSSQGVDWTTADDSTVKQMVTAMQNKANQELGVAPLSTQEVGGFQTLQQGGKVIASAAPKQATPDALTERWKQEVQGGYQGSLLDYQKELKSAGRAPQKPQSQFRAMNAEEIASAGLPAGSSAQIDEATGKIDVLSKRDQTATLSQKDATTAKMKLNTVKLARQQLNNIRQRFEPLKGSMSAGAFGQGKVPSEKGRAFDAAVNQMRSTLTALTRVPGVGAMSDYETKLDQSKFPTRDEYEAVTEQQIGDLDNMLNAIESGYSDLLNGGGGQQAAPQSGGIPVGQSVTIGQFTLKRIN